MRSNRLPIARINPKSKLISLEEQRRFFAGELLSEIIASRTQKDQPQAKPEAGDGR